MKKLQLAHDLHHSLDSSARRAVAALAGQSANSRGVVGLVDREVRGPRVEPQAVGLGEIALRPAVACARRIAALTLTLRLSTKPRIGTRTRREQAAASVSAIPSRSLPRTRARRGIDGEIVRCELAVGRCAATSSRPSALAWAITSSTFDQDAQIYPFPRPFATLGAARNRSRRSITWTNCTPNASQERRTAAPLWGSWGASKTTWTLSSRWSITSRRRFARAIEHERLEEPHDPGRIVPFDAPDERGQQVPTRNRRLGSCVAR